MDELPLEIIFHIASYLPIRDISALGTVSRDFNEKTSFIKEDLVPYANTLKSAWLAHRHRHCGNYMRNIVPGFWKLLEVHSHRSLRKKVAPNTPRSLGWNLESFVCEVDGEGMQQRARVENHNHNLLCGAKGEKNIFICSYTRRRTLYQPKILPYCAGCRRWLTAPRTSSLKWKTRRPLPTHYLLIDHGTFFLFFDSPSCIALFTSEHPDLSPYLQLILPNEL